MYLFYALLEFILHLFDQWIFCFMFCFIFILFCLFLLYCIFYFMLYLILFYVLSFFVLMDNILFLCLILLYGYLYLFYTILLDLVWLLRFIFRWSKSVPTPRAQWRMWGPQPRGHSAAITQACQEVGRGQSWSCCVALSPAGDCTVSPKKGHRQCQSLTLPKLLGLGCFCVSQLWYGLVFLSLRVIQDR